MPSGQTDSQTMHSQKVDYLVFQTACMPEQDIKCIVKNTFLELVDFHPSEHMSCARIRSSSESRVSLMRGTPSFDDDSWVAEGTKKTMLVRHANPQIQTSDSFSTISSIEGDGLSETTPSLLSDALEEPPTHPRTNSPMPSEASISDQETKDLSCQYRPTLATGLKQKRKDVLEALEGLTNLAMAENWTREDLMNCDITDRLYPYIPVDDEGCVTSLGSIQHAEGTCKPCAFLKKDRCHKKDLCLYCHFGHEAANQPKRTGARKSMAKRNRFVRWAAPGGPN